MKLKMKQILAGYRLKKRQEVRFLGLERGENQPLFEKPTQSPLNHDASMCPAVQIRPNHC